MPDRTDTPDLPDMFAQDPGPANQPEAPQGMAEMGSRLFGMLEDIIVGIVGFATGFVMTIIRFTISPRKSVAEFTEAGGPPRSWPQPYTFLAGALFVFFQLIRMDLIENLYDKPLADMISVDVGSLQRLVAEISLERFLLTALPATVLVIIVGSFMARLARERDAVRAHLAPRLSAYVFGTQLTLLLLIFHLTVGPFAMRRAGNGALEIIYTVVVLIVALYALVLPAVTLSRWFSRTKDATVLVRPWPLRILTLLAVTALVDYGAIKLLATMQERDEPDVTIDIADIELERKGEKVAVWMKVLAHNHDDGVLVPFPKGSVSILPRGFDDPYSENFASTPYASGDLAAHTPVESGSMVTFTCEGMIDEDDLQLLEKSEPAKAMLNVPVKWFSADGGMRIYFIESVKRQIHSEWGEVMKAKGDASRFTE